MYQFHEGELVKFRRFDQYTAKGLNPWTWLVVEDCSELMARVHLHEHPEQVLTVDLAELDPPLGYEEVYDVHVPTEDEARKVLGWLAGRGGVGVWASHDLGTAGRKMFTPGDRVKDGNPHWSVRLVETVQDIGRLKLWIDEESFERKNSGQDRAAGWKYDKHFRMWYRSIPFKG